MNQHYPFELLPLPYLYDALEPHVDMETMYFHHAKHLRSYIEKLNQALAPYPEYHNQTLERLLLHPGELPIEIREEVKRNAGGVYNHEFFFEGMTPGPRELCGQLKDALTLDFSCYRAFEVEFFERAMDLFGSGYLWLTSDCRGKLSIVSTANQDTPITRDMYPLLNLDLWEHAYYLRHKNLRADYIHDWFPVINWEEINRRYQQALLSMALQKKL